MAGSALSEEFRILRPGAKVLFMSAYEIETVEAYRVRLAPGEPFLDKPFRLADLPVPFPVYGRPSSSGINEPVARRVGII